MALTWADAAKLIEDNLWSGLAKSVYLSDDLYKVLPFARVNGRSHTYVRQGAALTSGWTPPGSTISESAQGFLEIVTRLRLNVSEVRIPGHVLRTMDGGINQIAAQLAAKADAVGRAYRDALINGNHPTAALAASLTGCAVSVVEPAVGPNHREGVGSLRVRVAGAARFLAYRAPGDLTYGTESIDCAALDPVVLLTSGDGYTTLRIATTSVALPVATTEGAVTISSTTYQFDGLRRLVSPTQVIDSTGPAGDAFSEEIGRRAIDLCEGSTDSKVLLMHRRTIRSYKTLLSAKGGTGPAMVQMERFGLPGEYLSLDGVPVIPCDSLPTNLSKGGAVTLTELYCVSLGANDGQPSEAPYQGAGLVGLYGGGGSDSLSGATVMGMFVNDLGPQAGNDYSTWQVGGEFGLALYGDKHCSCFRHITN